MSRPPERKQMVWTDAMLRVHCNSHDGQVRLFILLHFLWVVSIDEEPGFKFGYIGERATVIESNLLRRKLGITGGS
jgi:hypothetical protein